MPDAGQSLSGGCTCLRLRKAARRASQIYDQHLEPLGLTVTQFSLLGNVEALDGVGIGALAARMVMDPTTLTRNLRPLERRGYLVCATSAQDQRARSLHLTPAGRKLYRDAKPAWARAQRHVDKLLAGMDGPPINQTLDRVLERLAS